MMCTLISIIGQKQEKSPTRLCQGHSFTVVREMRFELTRVAPYAPQTYASTCSATPAAKKIIGIWRKVCNPYLHSHTCVALLPPLLCSLKRTFSLTVATAQKKHFDR